MGGSGPDWEIVALADGALRLGVHRAGPRPAPDGADIPLTVDPDPPAPWVGVEAGEIDARVAELSAAAAVRPIATAVLVQVLRMSLALPFEDALVTESLAYSTLLAGAEFAAWRAATPVRAKLPKAAAADEPWVRLTRGEAGLLVTLARSDARNAVNARLRDELVEALEFALIDPEAGPVVLSGEGPAFSAGGDLNEFGQAKDLALAHAVRVRQSPARLARRLGARLTVRLHGPCIGAGIEIPAAAARVTAAPDAWFRLPEVSMGLIPGAGGTATITRRIGRERTCFMALSGRAVDAATALAWGLVDEIGAAP